MNNKDKMINGFLYDGSKDKLPEERARNWLLLQKYNTWPVSDLNGLDSLIIEILGVSGQNIRIKPPFYCDYGFNIHIGDNFFANYNLTILDTAPIFIGNNVKIGPNVSIFAAGHPIDPIRRMSNVEFGQEITIGNNVWIGGNTVINPGTVIGDSVIV